MATATKKHPGFNKVSAMMARSQGISQEDADAELAESSRKASPAAKKANPNLKKMKG